MAAERIIGVDFGTSTSVIRVKRYENGKPIGEKLEAKEVVFGDRALVPTVIMKKDDAEAACYFGYEAQQGKKNFTYFHSFKMDLESSDPEKRAQARQLTESFFSFLAKQYRSQSDGGHLGNPDDKERTIVSYPVKWNEGTKNFMLKTAAKAGFPNVTGMDEAQAAIQAVIVMNADHLHQNGLLQKGVGSNVLLIDMGAGTTDLVLARYTLGDETETEVLNTWPKSGDIQFGGREIDHLLQKFFRQMLDEGDAEKIFDRIGTDKFKSWKEGSVSPALRQNDSVKDFTEFDNLAGFLGLDLDYCLDRTAFENCLADYLRQFPQLINGCLQNAGMTGNDVDLVIVTGGHSQWYFVGEMLEGKMPQFGEVDLPKIKENPGRIIPISRPQETVALGLAYNGIHDTDEYEPIPPGRTSEPTFTMEITRKSSTPGGACVGGVISLGEVSVGDILLMWDANNMWDEHGENVHLAKDINRLRSLRSVKVKKIELKKNGSTEQKPMAVEDESVVLLLEGIKEAELYEGLILFKDKKDYGCDHAPLGLVQWTVERWKERHPEVITDKISTPTFTMEIRQIISKPEGYVVEGTISLGEVVAGDTVYIWDTTGKKCRSATIKRIGLCSKNNGTIIKDAAAENDVVAVRLDGIMATELSQGMILFKDTEEFQHAPLQWVRERVERWKARQPVVPGPDPGRDSGGGNNSNGGTIINGGALGMGSDIYTIPQGKSVPGAVQTVRKFLVSKKMEVQELKTEEGYVVQARKKGLFGKNAKGNASALEIRLAPIGDDQVAIKVGGGKWASIAAKSGGAIVSTLVLGPLAPIGAIAFIISAGVDAQLIGDTKKLIKDYFTC